MFVSCAWSPDLDEWLRKQEDAHEQKLDIILMNSVIWDVNRWGPNFVDNYKKNISKLIDCVKKIMADDGTFIWLTGCYT